MDTTKLAKALMMLGVMGAILSVVWWYKFYTDVIIFLKIPRSVIWQQDVIKCIFTNSGGCGNVTGAAKVAGYFVYEPFALWCSLGIILISIVIRFAYRN